MSIADRIEDISWDIADFFRVGDFFDDYDIPPQIFVLAIIAIFAAGVFILLPTPQANVICGNGVCSAGETEYSCPIDCVSGSEVVVEISNMSGENYTVELHDSSGERIAQATARDLTTLRFSNVKEDTITATVRSSDGSSWRSGPIDVRAPLTGGQGGSTNDGAQSTLPGAGGTTYIITLPDDFEDDGGGEEDDDGSGDGHDTGSGGGDDGTDDDADAEDSGSGEDDAEDSTDPAGGEGDTPDPDPDDIVTGGFVSIYDCIADFMEDDMTVNDAYLLYLSNITDSLKGNGQPPAGLDMSCADINEDTYWSVEDYLCAAGLMALDFRSISECPDCISTQSGYEICNDGVDNNCDGQVDNDTYDNEADSPLSHDLCVCADYTPCGMMKDLDGIFSAPGAFINESEVMRCASINSQPHIWHELEARSCNDSTAASSLACGSEEYNCSDEVFCYDREVCDGPDCSDSANKYNETLCDYEYDDWYYRDLDGRIYTVGYTDFFCNDDGLCQISEYADLCEQDCGLLDIENHEADLIFNVEAVGNCMPPSSADVSVYLDIEGEDYLRFIEKLEDIVSGDLMDITIEIDEHIDNRAIPVFLIEIGEACLNLSISDVGIAYCNEDGMCDPLENDEFCSPDCTATP